tara:strand:+ start:758 stop:1012 length:255 start_codon:yes stop_codon:yes gene_type:complete
MTNLTKHFNRARQIEIAESLGCPSYLDWINRRVRYKDANNSPIFKVTNAYHLNPFLPNSDRILLTVQIREVETQIWSDKVEIVV